MIVDPEQKTKNCPKCKKVGSASEFGYRTGKNSHLLNSWCKDCVYDLTCENYKKRNTTTPVASKVCPRCKYLKPQSEFSYSKKQPSGLKSWCRRCDSVKKREKGLKERHNITIDEYNGLLAKQQSLCAICKKESEKSLHVDHDHGCCPGKTGACGNCIRGLLCFRCNSLLGMAGDDVAVLKSAIEYLTRQGGD